MTSTTTCEYHNAVNYLGETPTIQEGRIEPWNFSDSTCVTFVEKASTTIGFNPTTTISTSTDVVIYGYMSSGEVLISTLLILNIFILLFFGLASALNKITTKKRYLQYNGGDVQVRDDI